MKVAIIGQGYVGSAIGIAAQKVGHEVIGIEVDENRRKQLASMTTYLISGDYTKVNDSDIVVIAVPTPLSKFRTPDLTYLESACKSLREVLKSPVLLINESTSYPGTLRKVIAPLLGDKHLYAAAPERIDPGNAKWGIDNTPRLVSGLTSEATQKALDFYRSFCKSVHEVSTPEVAEAAKLFENAFRQVNIALVNEFAQITKALGISSDETLRAAATKPFGFMPFVPSIGVGGHCIPVDPSYLSYAAEKVGIEASFINLANQVNNAMPEYLAGKIKELMGKSLVGMTIQISGIAYKPDVADTRESPALILLGILRNEGAEVIWHDELVGEWNNEISSPLTEVDLGIIATAHSGVDYSLWKNKQTLVINASTSPDTGWPKFL